MNTATRTHLAGSKAEPNESATFVEHSTGRFVSSVQFKFAKLWKLPLARQIFRLDDSVVISRSLILSLLIAMLLPTVAAAQPGLFGGNARRDEDLFLLAPRSLQRLLNEGREALAEKRYAEGIAALGTLLTGGGGAEGDELLGQDFFLETERPGIYTRSIKGEAIRLLSDLTEDGRKSLEIAFGVKARQQLDAGVAARNFEAVSDVVRKYMHTEAGYDAMILAAQYKLASGYPLAAASLLQRLLEFPAARERFGAQLAVSTALAYRQADRVDLAISSLKQSAVFFPGAEIDVAGRAVPLEAGSDWVKIVGNLSNTPMLSDNAVVDAWTISGGSPERNATNYAGMPLSNARWFERIHGSLKEEEALTTVSTAARQQNNVILPKLEARVVNDLVLFKTTNSAVLARDFETGILKWQFFLHGTPLQLTNGPQISENGELGGTVSEELKNRVWGSSAFGNFSCDTERLYFVSSDAEQPLSAQTITAGPAGNISMDSNYLEGVSLAAEGAMLWRLGGATSDADHSLANAFFLGPPLPFENQLYTLVELNGETHLVVLDPETGKVVWQQQLISSQAEISQDLQRRSLALSPTISDGVILCPTGSGAVIAVDLMTRSLRWARTYPTSQDGRNNHLNGMRMLEITSNYEPLAQRWHEPFIVADQGRILMTPPESDLLICLDVLTGENKWRVEGIKRGAQRYVVGANKDFVVLAGNTQINAYRYDGNPAWDCPLPKGQTLAGKGIWQGDSMLIPLSGRQVIKVNAADGKILETATVDIPLGNLFAYKQQIVSISPTYVAAYYTREALEGEVATRLAKNANDTWALNQQSQLALASGNLNEAISQLEKSYQLDAQNADTRFLLVETLLRGLDEDFVQYKAVAERFAEVFDLPQQRFRFLQSMALGNVKSEQHFAAAQNLLLLVRNRLTESIANQPQGREMLTVAAGHQVDSETWLAVQLARTYASASSEERSKIYDAVRKELDSAQHSLAPNRRQLLKYFAWLPDSSSDVLQMARSLTATEPTLAERFVQPILHGNDQQASQAAWQLLNENPKQDWLSLGPFGTYVQRLMMNAADMDSAAVEKLRQQFPNFHADSITVPQLQAAKFQWPSGLVVKGADQTDSYSGGGMGYNLRGGAPLPISQNRYGRPPLVIRLLGQQNLVVLNEIGQEVGSLEFERGTGDGNDFYARCQVDGGLILIETASELLAIDLYRDNRLSDSLLWRYSLQSPSASPSIQTTQTMTMAEVTPLGFTLQKRTSSQRKTLVGPITPVGIPVQSGSTLSMLDGLTGTTLWTIDGLSDQTRFASSGVELAVVEPSAGTVLILDCRDGTELRRVNYRGDWQPWFANGSLMVDYERQPSKNTGIGVVTTMDQPVTLRIWNAFTGEVIQRLELKERTRANCVDDRYIVAIESTGAKTGTLHFIDLIAQSHRAHAVPKDAEIDSLGVLKFEDRLAVFAYSGRTITNPRSLQRTNTIDAIVANGMVYGLNSNDGSLLWERPASLQNYLVPLVQPRSSPFVAAYRLPQYMGNQREPGKAGLILFDLRDGSLAFANDAIMIPHPINSMFSMSLLPLDGAVSIGLGETNYLFKPTDKPKPPQPIFRFGASRPAAQRAAFEFFGN